MFETLKDLEILFVLALVTVILFRRLKFPSIIGFLATGILAGTETLPRFSALERDCRGTSIQSISYRIWRRA